MIYPISFCIPQSKILPAVPPKTKLYAHIVPGHPQTYIYGTDEKAYYHDYAQSVFGITHKKAGWDCLRHYEILANGCIPFFKDLAQCPTQTMVHFPKALVLEAMATLKTLGRNRRPRDCPRPFGARARPSEPSLAGTPDLNSERVVYYINELLAYTRKHLTTVAMAQFILDKIEHLNVKSVLFISGNMGVDYMRCLLLHGFKELFGSACHDFPSVPHLYTDFPVGKLAGLYGCGMSVSRLIDRESNRAVGLDATVEQDIAAHKYDIIIYGSIHRGLPHWDLVCRHYATKDIVLICGEDLHGNECKSFANAHDLFLREQ